MCTVRVRCVRNDAARSSSETLYSHFESTAEVKVLAPATPNLYPATPTLLATDPEDSQQCTRDTKMRRKESMARGFWTLSMAYSHHLFCPQPEAWGENRRPSTSVWQTCWLTKEKFHTACSWVGSDANSPLPSSDLLLCASGEADPPGIIRSRMPQT